MANGVRGEIEAELDGRRWTLCLTLGALAELETAFEADDLAGLAERLAAGRLSARDAIALIGAGLRGGGSEVSDDAVAAMASAGGVPAYAAIVARLIGAAFGAGGDGEGGTNPPPPRA
ncbi:gene transfer agent family protein [Pseudoxanthobacter sp. M-2]|uniref:gene transfer agent family protein n=1 Tax=Pseudoxanthobacter sp. M-2 TaxID=3078754 RepID=UPI0038FD2F82